MSNQAAWLTAAKTKPLKVDSAPYPRPAADEVIIKNAAVAINPVDWKVQDYAFGNFVGDYPAIMGADVSGEIVEVGSSVTGLALGQRVIAHAHAHTTHENKHAGFQLYIAVPSISVAPLPSSISFAQGSVLPLAVSTAAAGLYMPGLLELPLPSVTSASSDKTKTLLIWGGASSVGSATIQLACASGLTVIVTASSRNFEFVKSLGAAQVFDYSKANVVEDIVGALKGTQFVGAYDAIASPETVKTCAEVVKAVRGGGLVAAVLPPPRELPDGIEAKSFLALDIFHQYPDVGKAVWAGFVPEALKNGRLQPKPDPLVVGKGLDKIQDGLDKLKAGVSAKKVVVEL